MELRDLVEEVCKHAEVLAGDKDIRIIIAFLESVKINGDEVRLRQMVWNILHNGIKYTRPGGELKVSLQDEGEFALLSIQDTGIGIPEKDLPSIFDRFYRVDKARSRDEGGSGLGLSICKHIAEAHKGKIEVESKLDVGTRFKIRIPTLSAVG
jgi:two-component system phosphate regulon sensor histidine kinase PhoR